MRSRGGYAEDTCSVCGFPWPGHGNKPYIIPDYAKRARPDLFPPPMTAHSAPLPAIVPWHWVVRLWVAKKLHRLARWWMP